MPHEQDEWDPTPREIIEMRRDGVITSEEMMRRLRAYHYTSFLPAVDDWDPLAVFALPNGTIKQLGHAFDDDLLSEEEHDSLVMDPDLHVTRTQMPSQKDLGELDES